MQTINEKLKKSAEQAAKLLGEGGDQMVLADYPDFFVTRSQEVASAEHNLLIMEIEYGGQTFWLYHQVLSQT